MLSISRQMAPQTLVEVATKCLSQRTSQRRVLKGSSLIGFVERRNAGFCKRSSRETKLCFVRGRDARRRSCRTQAAHAPRHFNVELNAMGVHVWPARPTLLFALAQSPSPPSLNLGWAGGSPRSNGLTVFANATQVEGHASHLWQGSVYLAAANGKPLPTPSCRQGQETGCARAGLAMVPFRSPSSRRGRPGLSRVSTVYRSRRSTISVVRTYRNSRHHIGWLSLGSQRHLLLAMRCT